MSFSNRKPTNNTKLVPIVTPDDVPRVAPAPTPGSNKITPTGPAVPEVSILYPNKLSSETIPIKKQSRDKARPNHNDPDASFIYISPEDRHPKNSRENLCIFGVETATTATLTNTHAMFDSLSEIQMPPRPTAVGQQPPKIQPCVPEISIYPNDKLWSANSILQPYNPNAILSRAVHLNNSNFNRKNQDCGNSPGQKRVFCDKSVQTTPDMCNQIVQTAPPDVCDAQIQIAPETCDQEIQVCMESDRNLPRRMDAGCREAAAAAPQSGCMNSVLNRDMVVHALNEMNNIFAMPVQPNRGVSKIQSISSPENVCGFVCKTDMLKKGSNNQARELRLDRAATDRNAIMRKLIMKYLPDWQQKLTLLDDEQKINNELFDCDAPIESKSETGDDSDNKENNQLLAHDHPVNVLSRSEMELIQAFRDRRVFMIMNRSSDMKAVAAAVGEDMSASNE